MKVQHTTWTFDDERKWLASLSRHHPALISGRDKHTCLKGYLRAAKPYHWSAEHERKLRAVATHILKDEAK